MNMGIGKCGIGDGGIKGMTRVFTLLLIESDHSDGSALKNSGSRMILQAYQA